MNKRQRKKQSTYRIKEFKSAGYKALRRMINFYASKSDEKINNKTRWRVLEKVHIQEEKSEWKRMIKNMYRFYTGEIEFEKIFEYEWGEE